MLGNWDDIKLFEKVVALKSYSKAAESLNISQPTVSRRMKLLQTDLGFTLFERSERGLIPTEKALVLYNLAGNMVNHAQSFEIAARSLRHQKQTINIACSPLIGLAISRHIPMLIDGLDKVNIALLTSPNFVSLEKGEADIALRNVLPEKGNLLAKSLGQNQFGIFGGVDFMEKHKDLIDQGELSTCPWVGYPKSMAHMPSNKWLSQNIGISAPDIQLDSSLLILDAVVNNMGLAVLPTYLEQTHNLIAVRKSLDGLSFKSWLVSHAQTAHDPMITEVKHRIEAVFKNELYEI
ncbi:MAG: LysR family transcriptional regulator [Methylocystaceae bacterium]|nr:LysR family transcriptional regulator [Methylocystaceae bacterium]